MIRLYQLTISPDHSFLGKRFFPNGYCQYWPSCSAYGYQAVEKYGILRGLGRAVWRVTRCNPWSKGGIDEVK
ncbi:TPA: membrane protein insertion efficiency factor YidD [Candidatus Uhrbacteria bacterium]|nr:membrane protein insertion efficiency factor YidD [Candidatus Uhrbacteria bacterium]